MSEVLRNVAPETTDEELDTAPMLPRSATTLCIRISPRLNGLPLGKVGVVGYVK
jgi:hypothetical protein